MEGILKQEEIEALLEVCEDLPSDTERTARNLQDMHDLLRRTPVKGIVDNTYIEVTRDKAELMMLHLKDAIRLLK